MDSEESVTRPRRMLEREAGRAGKREPLGSVLVATGNLEIARSTQNRLTEYGLTASFKKAVFTTISEESILEVRFAGDSLIRKLFVDYLVCTIPPFQPRIDTLKGIRLKIPAGLTYGALVVDFQDWPPNDYSFLGGHTPDLTSFADWTDDPILMADMIVRSLESLEGVRSRMLKHRPETLPFESAGQLFASAESLFAEAQTVIDDEPVAVGEEDLEQLRHDLRLARTALQSPRPDAVTVERALARITQVLKLVAPSPNDLMAELHAGGLSTQTAVTISEGLLIVGDKMAQLGAEQESDDLFVGMELQAAVTRIDRAVSGLADPYDTDDRDGEDEAQADVDVRALIRDARLRGRVKFWSEVWPEQKAKVIATATVAGTTASVAATSQLGIPASLLRLARTVLQTIFT